MLNQILSQEGDLIPSIPTSLQATFPHIVTDPAIHAGWPHIKGTRILAVDVFRAQVKGYSSTQMIMEFKEMGVSVSEKELDEAFRFTLEWLRDSTHGKKSSKASK